MRIFLLADSVAWKEDKGKIRSDRSFAMYSFLSEKNDWLTACMIEIAI